MGDVLPDLILIESLIGGAVQLRERLVKAVGDGLALTFIYIGGETDAQDGDDGRGEGNLRVEVDGVVLTAGRHERAKRTAPAEETGQRGIDTHAEGDHGEHDEGNGHRQRSLVRGVVLVSLHVLRAPEDAVVQTEHVEGGHGGDAGHDPSHHRAVGEAGGDDLILRAEAREERDACNGKAGDEERDVGDGHVLAQATHQRHLVRVDGMDDAAGSEEQTSLEHGVGEQMEHTGHVAQLGVVVEDGTMMTRQADAESHHHEGNLRDGGEGQHTLDVALGASHGSGIEGGDDTHHDDHRHGLRSVLNPQGEHAGNLEHTGDHHRGSMDEGRHRRGAFHGIGQPDVQGEHGALTCTTDEHQHQGRGDDAGAGRHGLGHITLDEGRRALPHHDVASKREAERIGEVAEGQDTDEEEHIGKTRHDECLLRGGDGGLQRIVESDEQVAAHAHELPEHVHLEDVRGQHQAQHRHGEEREESIVALEALLAVHIAERVDVHHEADRGDDNEHHHRDGIEQDAHVEMQVAQGQPGEVVGDERLEDAVHTVSREVLEGREIRQDGDESERAGADKSGNLMLHLHAAETEHKERQQRQEKNPNSISVLHNLLLVLEVSNTVYAVATEFAVNIDNDGNGDGRLGGSNANDKERHEHALHAVGIEQAVDGCEVDVDSIQDELHRDEHGDEVAAGDKAEDANEEQQCAKHEITFYWYHSLILLLSCNN